MHKQEQPPHIPSSPSTTPSLLFAVSMEGPKLLTGQGTEELIRDVGSETFGLLGAARVPHNSEKKGKAVGGLGLSVVERHKTMEV